MRDQPNLTELVKQELESVTGGIGDTFEKAKPHCNVGTIGHLEQVDFLPKVKLEIVVAE